MTGISVVCAGCDTAATVDTRSLTEAAHHVHGDLGWRSGGGRLWCPDCRPHVVPVPGQTSMFDEGESP